MGPSSRDETAVLPDTDERSVGEHRWEALLRPGRKAKPGSVLRFGAGGLEARVVATTDSAIRGPSETLATTLYTSPRIARTLTRSSDSHERNRRMADTYEKRARERRKQQKRREKLARKQNADPDAPRQETDASEYLMTPEDREEMEETEE